jgi:hypothetical protein
VGQQHIRHYFFFNITNMMWADMHFSNSKNYMWHPKKRKKKKGKNGMPQMKIAKEKIKEKARQSSYNFY